MVFLFCILLSISCQNPRNHDRSSAQTELQSVLDTLVKSQEIPGLNLSYIGKNGKVISYSSGYSDLVKRERMDSSKIMFSGSIGKTYAAALLMKYHEYGRINLDEKFLSYFPEETWLQRLANIQDISIRMLLQHTSGLPRYVMKEEIWEMLEKDPDKVWTYRERLAVIFDEKPVHAPGEAWYYSDTNYILLGMLLEKLSGKDYYVLLEEEILRPFSLGSTFASLSRDIPNLPAGYSRLPEMFRMPGEVVVDGRYVFNPQLEWTGGGLACTTPDLAKWASIYYGGEIFSDSILEMMCTPTLAGSNIAPWTSYGSGSFIFETRHGKAYGHTGFVPGFNSIFACFPEKNLYMALQSNCDYAEERIPLIEYLSVILDAMEIDVK